MSHPQQHHSQSSKSFLLWNVVDPDDPYDIRKSMIASLPEHTQNFMGEHLQIVCLMQAAEIQRLNIYLSDYKLKYRQLERKQLDRHSYQIQIKQLSQKANQLSKLRTDNEKLRQFIKRQSAEFEQLQKRPNIPANLQTQHEQLFKKYQAVLSELKLTREKLQSSMISFSSLTEEHKELRIRYDRLDKQRLTQLTQQRQKYELKIRERIQIQVKEVQHRLGSKIYQLESDCRLYKQQIQSKNQQITLLSSKIQSIRKQLQSKQRGAGKQLQEKARQLEQINSNLNKKIAQLQHYYSNYRRIQSQLTQVHRSLSISQQQTRQARNELTLYKQSHESQKSSASKELQNKSRELEQINITLSKKASQLERIFSQYTIIQNQMRQLQRTYQRSQIDNKHLRGQIDRLNQLVNTRRSDPTDQQRIVQLENKVALLSAQIQRLSFMLQQKSQSLGESQTRTSAVKTEYESKIRILITEYETKLSTSKHNQSQIQSLQGELSNYRSMVQQLRGKNQSLTKQITLVTGSNRRIYELEEEIKRLNMTIATKNQQIYNMQARLRGSETLNLQVVALRKSIQEKDRAYEGFESERTGYELRIRSLSKDLQQSRKQIQKQRQNNLQIRSSYDNSKILLSQGEQIGQKLRKQLSEAKRIIQQYQIDVKKGNLISPAELSKHIQQVRIRVRMESQLQIRKVIQQKMMIQHTLQEVSYQATQLKQELSRKQQSLQSTTVIETRYQTQIQDLTNSFKVIREENQKLQAEKNRLKGLLSQTERELVLRQNEYFQKISDLGKRNQELTGLVDELRRDNARIKQQVGMSQERVLIIQRQIQQKYEQIKRQNIRLRQQLQIFQQKQPSIQRQYEIKIQQIIRQNTRLKQDLTVTQQKFVHIQRDYEPRIQQLRRQNSRLKEDFITIQQRIGGNQREYEQMKRENIKIKQQLSIVTQKNANIQREYEPRFEEYRRENNKLRQELGTVQQRNSLLQRQCQQLRRANSQYAQQIQALKSQLAHSQKYTQQLQQKQSTIQSIQRQLATARQQMKMLQATYENSNNTMKNYRQRLLSVSQQIERLNQLLVKRNGEIQQLKRRGDGEETIRKQLRQKQQQFMKIKVLLENTTTTLRIKQQEIITIKTQTQSVQPFYKQRIVELEQQLSSLKMKYESLDATTRRQLQQKQQLIRSIRGQFQTMDPAYKRQLKEKDDQISILKNQLEKIQASFRKKIAEKDNEIEGNKNKIENIQSSYRRQLRQKQQQIRINGQKIMRLAHQKDNMEKQIRFEYQSKIKIMVQSESKSLASQLTALSRTNQSLRQEIISLQSHLQSRTSTISSLESQIANFQSQIHQSQSVIATLKNKPSPDPNLVKKLQEQEIQIKNLRLAFQQLEDINQHTIAQRDQLFQLSHEYKAEIQKFKILIKDSTRNQQDYIQLSNKFNQLNYLYTKCQDELKIALTNIETLTKRNRQYDSKLRETIMEVERLTTILQQRQNSLTAVNELRQKINEMRIQNSNIAQVAKQWEQKYILLYQAYISETQSSKSKIMQYQKKISILDQQFEQLNMLIQTMKQENIELRTQITSSSQLIQKNNYLSQEIDRLNTLIATLKQELSDTRLHLTDQLALQKRIEQYMTLMVILFAEIQTLRMRVSATEKQCEDVRRSSLTPFRVDHQETRQQFRQQIRRTGKSVDVIKRIS